MISHVKKIAIVGAGPAGVAALKSLLKANHFDSIEVFEQRDGFGGVWNYTEVHSADVVQVPQTDPNYPSDQPRWRYSNDMRNGHGDLHFLQALEVPTPMYRNLETNIPNDLMRHSDDHSLEQYQLFPTRSEVLNYLERYAESIRKYVAFHTQVQSVDHVSSDGHDMWSLTAQDLMTSNVFTKQFDAVIVCNGHYSVPSLPNIKGIAAWHDAYPGSILHSKFFRDPANFKGKKVIVVGNSASGTDISLHLSSCAQLPILISKRSRNALAYPSDFKQDVPEILEFIPPSREATRAVRFADGRVEPNVDLVLFCTGYFYSFPFLSSLDPTLVERGERVKNVYQHIFYTPNPTLTFVGLPSKIIPFRTFEAQAAVITRAFCGMLQLPSRSEMEQWERERVVQCGSCKDFHVFDTGQDFDYHNFLLDWAKTPDDGKLLPPAWNEREYWERARIRDIKKVFVEKGELRHKVRTVDELGIMYGATVNDK